MFILLRWQESDVITVPSKMSKLPSLPPLIKVQKWTVDDVVHWLKKVKLDDCIEPLQSRNIDGQKLLELNESVLFTFSDLKIKRRGQLAKCVNECKAQATYAKKLVESVRTHLKSQSTSELHKSSAYVSDDDDECGWDTDFDSEDDEPVATTGDSGIQLVYHTNGQSEKDDSIEPATEDMEKEKPVLNDVNNVDDKTADDSPKEEAPVTENKSVNGTPSNVTTESTKPSPMQPPKMIPKPPDKPAIPRPPLVNPNVISRYPTIYKRPSVLPPPPPVTPSPVTSPKSPKPEQDQEDEEYLIPIGFSGSRSQSMSSICPKSPPIKSPNASSSIHPVPSNQENRRESSPELYEVINSLPEENYETIADVPEVPAPKPPWSFHRSSSLSALSPSAPEQPSLPPRSKELSNAMLPPPLPEKPRKILEATTSLDKASELPGYNSHSANETKSVEDGVSLPPLPPDRPFPKTIEALPAMSRSSSNSSISSGSTATPLTRKRTPPSHLGHQNYDDNAIDVANRPLPPLPPLLNSCKDHASQQQESLSHYPWFHDIERDRAALHLLDMGEEGAYLVRPSKRAGKCNPYTLTILHDNKIFHIHIRVRADGRFALGMEKEKERTFDSVVQLVEYHQNVPISLTTQKKQAGKTCLKVHLGKS